MFDSHDAFDRACIEFSRALTALLAISLAGAALLIIGLSVAVYVGG